MSQDCPIHENTREKYGNDEVKTFPCTIGLNKKRGVNKKEFKNIFLLILFLYFLLSEIFQENK